MKSLLITTATVALLAVSSMSFASGADTSAGARTGDAVAYQIGKRVYATQFSCKSCPLSGKKLTKDSAKAILNGEPKVSLSDSDAQALATFLKRRFKL
ncbi:hypothetical protein NBRC116494_00900 [Aurantivibrio plasticivorans]